MIDLFFYGQLIAMVLSIIGSTFFGDGFNIQGVKISDMSILKWFFMICGIAKIVSFFFAIYHIKVLAGSFMKNKLFTPNTSLQMRLVGCGFIAYSFFESFAEYLYAEVTNTGDTFLSGNFMGFNSGWFQATLGVLFIFMDKLLSEANSLKQENDLTI